MDLGPREASLYGQQITVKNGYTGRCNMMTEKYITYNIQRGYSGDSTSDCMGKADGMGTSDDIGTLDSIEADVEGHRQINGSQTHWSRRTAELSHLLEHWGWNTKKLHSVPIFPM
jgi:hypothetical protein